MKHSIKQLFLHILLLFQNFFERGTNYKPVVIIHGLNDGAAQMADLKHLILKHHPGTVVIVPPLYEHLHSLENMWKQVQDFGEIVKNISDQSPDGINIIGYSQGGLVTRGILQTFDNININNFIALSSPINGQFGDTSWFSWLPVDFRSEASYFFYTTKVQAHISIANYWKDPDKAATYTDYSAYLAPLNNESTNEECKKFQPKWKENFMKVKNLVLIGGEDDGVITPWQSAFFGSYDANLNVHNMSDLTIYKDDVFGLKTMDEAGKIHQYQFGGIKHTHWHGNATVFEDAILPWLN